MCWEPNRKARGWSPGMESPSRPRSAQRYDISSPACIAPNMSVLSTFERGALLSRPARGRKLDGMRAVPTAPLLLLLPLAVAARDWQRELAVFWPPGGSEALGALSDREVRERAVAAVGAPMAATNSWWTDNLLHFGPAAVPFCQIMQLPFCAGAHYMVTEAFERKAEVLREFRESREDSPLPAKEAVYWNKTAAELDWWIDLTHEGIVSAVRLGITGAKPWWVCPFCRVIGGSGRICHKCRGEVHSVDWYAPEGERPQGLGPQRQVEFAARKMAAAVQDAGRAKFLRPERPFAPFCMFGPCKSTNESLRSVLPRFVVAANETLQSFENEFPAPLTRLAFARTALGELRRMEAFPTDVSATAREPHVAIPPREEAARTARRLREAAYAEGADDLWPSKVPFSSLLPCGTGPARAVHVLYAARMASREVVRQLRRVSAAPRAVVQFREALLREVDAEYERQRGLWEQERNSGGGRVGDGAQGPALVPLNGALRPHVLYHPAEAPKEGVRKEAERLVERVVKDSHSDGYIPAETLGDVIAFLRKHPEFVVDEGSYLSVPENEDDKAKARKANSVLQAVRSAMKFLVNDRDQDTQTYAASAQYVYLRIFEEWTGIAWSTNPPAEHDEATLIKRLHRTGRAQQGAYVAAAAMYSNAQWHALLDPAGRRKAQVLSAFRRFKADPGRFDSEQEMYIRRAVSDLSAMQCITAANSTFARHGPWQPTAAVYPVSPVKLSAQHMFLLGLEQTSDVQSVGGGPLQVQAIAPNPGLETLFQELGAPTVGVSQGHRAPLCRDGYGSLTLWSTLLFLLFGALLFGAVLVTSCAYSGGEPERSRKTSRLV